MSRRFEPTPTILQREDIELVKEVRGVRVFRTKRGKYIASIRMAGDGDVWLLGQYDTAEEAEHWARIMKSVR